MNRLFAALAAACACLGLAACASTGPMLPPSAQDAFTRACAERPTVYAAFLIYDAAKPVSADLRRTVVAANSQIAKVCKNPPADVLTAAATVTNAIAKIRRAAGKEV